jgi:hypothetical protein
MSVLSREAVHDWQGQRNTLPVQLRALAARFRRGESLETPELVALRDWAVANGNELLAQRCREELRNS